MPRNKVFMVYIEPTPYVIKLVDACREIWDGEIEVVYLTQNSSQNWDIQTDTSSVIFKNRSEVLIWLWKTLSKDGCKHIFHLAGWGNAYLALTILFAWLVCVPIFVETDTSQSRSKSFLKNLIKSKLYMYYLNLPTHFFPGGSRQANYLSQFGISQEKMTIAQMTVDVEEIIDFEEISKGGMAKIFRERYQIPETSKVILYLARIEKYKGIYDLISAFKQGVPDSNARLVVVGDGSELINAMNAAATDERIIFTGRLTGDKVWTAYYASDIFVIPSVFEPWGLTVNEAMAAGLPVIATDQVGAVDDLIKHMKTGIQVKANDPFALANNINVLLQNTELANRIAGNARTLIKRWTIKNEASILVSKWEAARWL